MTRPDVMIKASKSSMALVLAAQIKAADTAVFWFPVELKSAGPLRAAIEAVIEELKLHA